MGGSTRNVCSTCHGDKQVTRPERMNCVVDVLCGGCTVWWMYCVVDVLCGGCRGCTVWLMYCVVDVGDVL